MDPLPAEVYSAASVRAMDRRAIEHGIPGYDLMQRAGDAAFEAMRRHWPAANAVAVLCGPGNNAGDGYVVARRARAAGLDVRVVAVADPRALAGDAARAHADFAAEGGRTVPPGADALAGRDLVVDALLGTGTDRGLGEPYASAIEQVNASRLPVFALDIPSGLDADTGVPHGIAIRATRTITFAGLKAGCFLGRAPDCVGELEFDALGLPPHVRAGERPVLRRIDGRFAARALPGRRRTAHKGEHGSVAIVGGHAMAGAARLAGEAALRTGAGLVSVLTSAQNVAAIVAGRPELIVRPASHGEVHAAIRDCGAVAVGPGLGTQGEAAQAFDAALEQCDRLVVDADALTLLAARFRKSDRWILTPHPGEAARLLAATPSSVQQDRLGAVRELAARYGGTVVLKGANTLVSGPDADTWVCDRGNPGMATAGSGDVLTGVIAALQAAGNEALDAAAAGVLIHAEAGDRAARAGQRGMIASDIIGQLRGVVNHTWS
jgi:NAD(P)H-hydrate epimerase